MCNAWRREGERDGTATLEEDLGRLGIRDAQVADLCRRHGITEQTYSRWKAKYGGMERSEMQRLKQIEDENRRLKQIVVEQTLDTQALGLSSDRCSQIGEQPIFDCVTHGDSGRTS